MTPDDPHTRPADGDELRVDEFRGEPTRDLSRWYRLWNEDRSFPIDSHRPFFGRLLVAFKRFLRPLAKAPVQDLWDRQRTFNLILLEHLQALEARRHDERLGHLENFVPLGLDEVLRHNDALFSRVDQKLDRARRETRQLSERLGAALAQIDEVERVSESKDSSQSAGSGSPLVPENEDPSSTAVADAERAALTRRLVRVWDEQAYLELEARFRGTEEEIGERIRAFLPDLPVSGTVLDLGCGRGESLAIFSAAGHPVRGVDSSAEMVAKCQERGLDAVEGDLFEVLAKTAEGSLGAVVSFHVIEHLPPESLERLGRLAYRALGPGGVLILETPNPLSIVVAARNFWLDPTHQRPVHPESLALFLRVAGFAEVERRDLRPFPTAARLPEIDLETLPTEQREVADQVNRLRDRLDDLLFGYQDFALIARKSR